MENKLNQILEHYEKTEKTESVFTDSMSESDYELWEYLCGNENVRHLYNYYDAKTIDNVTISI